MILETEDLSHWYGPVTALNDVTVSAGEGITGLLGPNGSGKTTLLRLATGLMRPAAGAVRLLGSDPWNHPRLSRRMGYAPEHDGVYDFLTGRAFVTTMGKLRGFASREAARRAEEALHLVGLEAEADRRIATYSRGMRMRIKIAQAIAHDPELLLLDEPLTGSDPIVRAQLTELIRSRASNGRSVVFSSHVLHEVESLTRRVIVLHRGRLVADGDIGEIRDLIDRHPHTVRILAARPRELGAALAAEPGVVEIAFPAEGELAVRTKSPDNFYSRLPAVALEHGGGLEEIASDDDSLEAVFRYLTER